MEAWLGGPWGHPPSPGRGDVSLPVLRGLPAGLCAGAAARPGAEGLREKAPGAGVAEQVRNYTLRTSAPQVLGLLAQRRDGGPSPSRGARWTLGRLVRDGAELVPCPQDRAAHALEVAS